MSSFELYTERILRYWQIAQESRKHPSAITHTAEVQSEVCGDNVYCEANVQDDVLVEIGMMPRGCCICDSCCAIAAEYFTGKELADVNCPEEDWWKVVGVTIPENRQYCASMGWLALKALKEKK